MKEKRTPREGYVTLKRLKSGVWELRWPDAQTGWDKRKRVYVEKESEAREEARPINAMIVAGRKLAKRRDALTVREALIQSSSATGANRDTKRRYTEAINRFLAFLDRKYGIQNWSDMRPSIVIAYKQEMVDAGKAYDTIRNSLVPIKRASAYWAAEAPDVYRDYVQACGKQLSLQKPLPKNPPVLSAEQLEAFLAWLKTNAPILWAMAVLQGKAGLREFEAAHLRYGDVDFKNEIVTVAKTDTHTPKNRGSYRTIPVHADVIAAITDHTSAIAPVSEAAPLFVSTSGRPWTVHSLCWRWSETMKAARKVKELELPKEFTAHNLRATFVTLCRSCDRDLRKRYIGHTAGDVLGEHYESVTVQDLQAVVSALENALSSGKKIGNHDAKDKMISNL